MIGVNSLHSAGRLRSRSLCSVRYGRDFRMMDPFRYPRTPRSRSLKPLVFPDLLGKAQDGQKHPQFRKRKRVCCLSASVFCACLSYLCSLYIVLLFNHLPLHLLTHSPVSPLFQACETFVYQYIRHVSYNQKIK